MSRRIMQGSGGMASDLQLEPSALAEHADSLDPGLVIERETDVGSVLLQKDAEVFTPAVLEHGFWAREITELMRLTLRPGMTFVDAGANIGYFSVLGSKLVGPGGRVFSVEPDPLNLRILCSNLMRNSCTNVSVLPVAAWNERTSLNLFTPDEGGAGAHVESAEGGPGDVPAARLDELIDGTADYLKVDCEGSDHMVIMGAERLFDENPRMLATVEFFADVDSHTGYSPREILRVYERMNLKPYDIHEERGLRPTSYEEIAERRSPDPDVPLLFDFALSRRVPRRLVVRKSLLERGGDMLEHVPEPIRPKIRRRDRKPAWRSLTRSDVPDGASLDPGTVIEAETDLGPLLLEKEGVVVTRHVLETGSWDPTIGGLIRRTLRPGATFVDAGANIGYFSVLASQVVGPSGRVYAIEPDPLNLSILRANLDRHGCSNTTVLPVAAWSERAELNIFRQPSEGAVTRVGTEVAGSPIPAAPLDELIDGPVDYLKVDTEFTDHHVVAGSQGLIAQNPSMLVTVEFHPRHDSHNGESPAEVLDVYRRLELTPYEIAESGAGVEPTTYERLASATLPDEHISMDFALSRLLPDSLLYRKGSLERAGDLLEHLPERIRPKIRRRDRKAASGSQVQ